MLALFSVSPFPDFAVSSVQCRGSEAALSVCQHHLGLSPCTARVAVDCTCDSPEHLGVFESSPSGEHLGVFESSPTTGYYQKDADLDTAGWPEYRQVANIRGLPLGTRSPAKIRFSPAEIGKPRIVLNAFKSGSFTAHAGVTAQPARWADTRVAAQRFCTETARLHSCKVLGASRGVARQCKIQLRLLRVPLLIAFDLLHLLLL